MKHHITLILLVVFIFVMASCQSAVSTPALPASTLTPLGQMETQVAATIHINGTSTAAASVANQTSTAIAKLSPFYAARTADAMTAAARTPVPTAVVVNISVPASACWINSMIDVHMGQRVIVTASGIVNTFGGRDGSSNDPNGQKGVCGAIPCPLQGIGYGALIGRVDDGKSFFVGTELEFVPTRDGQLYFTVNDWECEDNSGEFILVIVMK